MKTNTSPGRNQHMKQLRKSNWRSMGRISGFSMIEKVSIWNIDRTWLSRRLNLFRPFRIHFGVWRRMMKIKSQRRSSRRNIWAELLGRMGLWTCRNIWKSSIMSKSDSKIKWHRGHRHQWNRIRVNCWALRSKKAPRSWSRLKTQIVTHSKTKAPNALKQKERARFRYKKLLMLAEVNWEFTKVRRQGTTPWRKLYTRQQKAKS